MVGPPISMFSISVSKSASDSFTLEKGYKLHTTKSIGSIPSFAASSASFSRSNNIADSILKDIVFILPPNASGLPVTCEISVTSIPASSKTFLVPPVEIISHSNSRNAFANSTIPFLSETLNKARLTFITSKSF